MSRYSIAIIGFGKIARDQHLPAIAADGRFRLAATVSRQGQGAPGLPCFADHRALIAALPDLDAVAIATPPSVRYEIARDCLEAGLHCLLEKPPAVTLGEVEALAALAGAKRLTLFTAWHAQHFPAVAAAAARLAGKRVRSASIVWREDVEEWHPGQDWIWEPGGFGVFDPGINAFSIATRIFPDRLLVREAELFVQRGRQMPIAAEIVLASPAADGPVTASLDWRHGPEEEWTITVCTEERVELHSGGSRLAVDGVEVDCQGPGDYPSLYARFAELLEAGQSEVDPEPLRIAADIFLAARRTPV